MSLGLLQGYGSDSEEEGQGIQEGEREQGGQGEKGGEVQVPCVPPCTW